MTLDPDQLVKVEDRAERDRLVGLGGVVVKERRVLVLDLGGFDVGMAPHSVTIQPLRLDAEQLVAIHHAVYTPAHPDHVPAEDDPVIAEDYFVSLLAGSLVGPLLAPASFEAVDDGGRLRGFVIASDRRDDEIYTGPWVSEFEVHPAARGRGLGTALMSRSVAALRDAGHATLGLAVTVGIDAERLYERLGFADSGDHSWFVRMPT